MKTNRIIENKDGLFKVGCKYEIEEVPFFTGTSKVGRNDIIVPTGYELLYTDSNSFNMIDKQMDNKSANYYVELKDYNYAVKYTIKKETGINGSIGGYFWVIKDIQIYLKNLSNKEKLKEVKYLVKEIDKENTLLADYSSLFSHLLSAHVERKYYPLIDTSEFFEKDKIKINRKTL